MDACIAAGTPEVIRSILCFYHSILAIYRFTWKQWESDYNYFAHAVQLVYIVIFILGFLLITGNWELHIQW